MQISEIMFTSREIDVISCILNARNIKKIATILLISPRTVETHIQNILLKIKGNSQEAIIDFIEKSTEFKFIKEHYLNLLIKTAFEHQLKRISYLAKKCQASCYISYNDQQDYQKDTLQSLIKHLKIAGIELLVNCNNDTQSNKNLNCNYSLYVLSHKNIEQIIVDELLQDKQSNIFLIIDNDTNKLTAKNFLHSDIVDFSIKEQYFHNILKILGKLLSGIDCGKFISEFEQYRINIINAKTDIIPELFSSTQNTIIIDQQQDTLLQKISSKRLYFVLGGLVCFIILIIMFFLKVNSESRLRQNLRLVTQDDVSTILSKFFADLSPSNLVKEQAEKNYTIIKQFDQVIEQINSGHNNISFNSNVFTSDKLINCLYNLNSIASFSLFKEHDAKKAEKILKHAKYLAENYILARSKLQIDFSKLTAAETYTELSIVQDLPEMYTITIYFLGRSFLYQNNIELAEKYFELSRYLGGKLGLFEEVLSTTNGLLIIKRDRIDILIKNGNYEQARKDLNECIDIYGKIKEDTEKYKINYRPKNFNPEIIIPKKDIYNIINCSKRIIKLYKKLIEITDDKNEIKKYINTISNQLLGHKVSSSILEKSMEQLNRIVADLYNNLGFLLLRLYDKEIEFQQLKNGLVEKLNLTNGDDLEIIYQVFDLAKSLSRSTEFSKADAYAGLAEVCKRLIRRINITEEDKKKLSTKVEELEKKRDYINKKLNRESYL